MDMSIIISTITQNMPIISILMIIIGGLIFWKGVEIFDWFMKNHQIILGIIGAIVGVFLGTKIGYMILGDDSIVGIVPIVFGIVGYIIGSLILALLLLLTFIDIVVALCATMNLFIAVIVAFIIYLIALCVIVVFFKLFGLLLYLLGLYLFGGIPVLILGSLILIILLFKFAKDGWKSLFTLDHESEKDAIIEDIKKISKNREISKEEHTMTPDHELKKDATIEDIKKFLKDEDISKEEYKSYHEKPIITEKIRDTKKIAHINSESVKEDTITEEKHNKKKAKLKNSKPIKARKKLQKISTLKKNNK